MLSGYEKFRLPDENKENDVLCEVNWEPLNPKLNDCKFIRIIFPDKKTAVIKKEYFLSMIFAMGSPEEQRKMVPQTLHKVRWYETILSIKAKNDIKKGENITFPIKLSMPTEREEIIAEANSKLSHKGIKLV